MLNALLTASLALLGATALAPAQAGEQADRAVAAVRQLVQRGELPAGTVLRLRAKQGNMVAMLGRDFELQREWERLTGIPIDASAMPQLDSLPFIRDHRDVDLTIARTHEFADLDAAGLIHDLRPLLRRFDFALPTDPASGYMLLGPQAMLGSKVLAIPADLDIAMLFLRADLMADAGNRERFRAQHGRELAPPRTWGEYEQLAAFFTRPADGLYGAGEPREPLTAWMYWLPRYLSAVGQGPALFDDRMRPLIDGPAGVAATESYVATVPHSPPQVLEDGKDYSYTLPLFLRGSLFSTILTTATAKIANREGSAIRGRVQAVPMPGFVVDGRLVRRTSFIYGNNLVLPRSGAHPELAFLFSMWLTDPDNSLRSVTANGIADPYRYHHLDDERVRALYTPQMLEHLKRELDVVVPAGTGLPGDAEYLQALSRQLWQAAAGRISAREAMKRAAKEWDAITDRLGRARQIERWRESRPLKPSPSAASR